MPSSLTPPAARPRLARNAGARPQREGVVAAVGTWLRPAWSESARNVVLHRKDIIQVSVIGLHIRLEPQGDML
jgi:hypothetical protein